MSELPYIPLNIADFLADDKVALMTTEEVGAYILLLCRAWQQERPGSLPNNDEFLAAWARLSELRWCQIKGRVMMPFWFNDSYPGGEWVQKRMARDHAQVSETLKKRSEAGKTAAEARWSPDFMQPQCDRSAKRKNKITTKSSMRCGLTWDEEKGWEGITEEMRTSWTEAYPQVDINSQLLQMNQWLVANPGKRKTQRGLPRFINAWLARANEKGNTNGNNHATEHRETGLGKVIDINGA